VFAIAIALLILAIRVPHPTDSDSDEGLLTFLTREWRSYLARPQFHARGDGMRRTSPSSPPRRSALTSAAR
jgi:hypothetical protein